MTTIKQGVEVRRASRRRLRPSGREVLKMMPRVKCDTVTDNHLFYKGSAVIVNSKKEKHSKLTLELGLADSC